jgi:predicted CopG family antitoxin
MVTTIKIQDTTWKRLNSRKDPGESFDEVVVQLLNDVE